MNRAHSRSDLVAQCERMEGEVVTVRASAPTRMCDNGGWTDTWFAEFGTVFSIAIEPRVHVEVVARPANGSRPPDRHRCSRLRRSVRAGGHRVRTVGAAPAARGVDRRDDPAPGHLHRDHHRVRGPARSVDRHLGSRMCGADRSARRVDARPNESGRRRSCRVASRDRATRPTEWRPGPAGRSFRRHQPDPHRYLPRGRG